MTTEIAITERMFVTSAACVGISNDALERLAGAGGVRALVKVARRSLGIHGVPVRDGTARFTDIIDASEKGRGKLEDILDAIGPLDDTEPPADDEQQKNGIGLVPGMDKEQLRIAVFAQGNRIIELEAQIAVLAEVAQELGDYVTIYFVDEEDVADEISTSSYILSQVLGGLPEAAQIFLARVARGDAAQSYLDVLRNSALWKLYDTGDGMRPCCKQCGEDSVTCCCDNTIREILNIEPPVGDEGNIIDQEAFDLALKLFEEEEREKDVPEREEA